MQNCQLCNVLTHHNLFDFRNQNQSCEKLQHDHQVIALIFFSIKVKFFRFNFEKSSHKTCSVWSCSHKLFTSIYFKGPLCRIWKYLTLVTPRDEIKKETSLTYCIRCPLLSLSHSCSKLQDHVTRTWSLTGFPPLQIRVRWKGAS